MVLAMESNMMSGYYFYLHLTLSALKTHKQIDPSQY